ncbi:heme/steroid binding protein, putative [Talaromyces stipitatus ATCC 10500]|uniref:Heme/steroid binding protein, putative n=1 Tax=Talaromyces stipitatus (strain ATCC 10500 / CBS 375.48 / QM 6759 / NRRL 1006) TaxID=441959 RepID=B8MJH2_TALSN|nr:heme/steroid binding protein, putative [Talaromyces stipitatus ATCC 10500]EED15172.1 heme/steroid binding protein, putative [Talaromyces stipitatus ATCC 10500]
MWSLTSLFTRSAQQAEVTQAKSDDVQQDNAHSETDSTQTTPKASAIVSTVQVPELNLQESDKSSDQTDQDAPTITSSSTPTTNNASLMLPPSAPTQRRPPTLKPVNQPFLAPPKLKASSLRPTSLSAASALRAPPATTNGLTTSTLAPSQRASRKVILGPGHSPLDWAALTKDPRNNLRGANLPPTLIKVTPSMLKSQNGRKGTDAWTSYNGKVYNITPYVSFHPGGKGELLRGAGKDSGKLFLETHPWVNWDGILGECLVGILVSENEKGDDETNELDAMD